MSFKDKYIKYKQKYLYLKGGNQLIKGGKLSCKEINNYSSERFTKNINGYFYIFSEKKIFDHPIILYIQHKYNLKNNVTFNNIKFDIQNIIKNNSNIDLDILIKQSLYYLILNILYGNDKKKIFDDLITYLIQTYSNLNLYNTLLGELANIIKDGFIEPTLQNDSQMPHLGYNNNVTQETIKNTATKISSRVTKNGLGPWLQIMDELKLSNLINADYEPVAGLISEYLNC